HPVRRPGLGLRRGRASRAGRPAGRRGADARDLLRLPADGVRAGRIGGAHRRGRVRRAPARTPAAGCGRWRAGGGHPAGRVAATGVRLHTVDAAGVFLAALAGVTDPEEKRKIIGREFIRAFERATREIAAEAGAHGEAVEFLVQGTLYPDVVESGGGSGTAS